MAAENWSNGQEEHMTKYGQTPNVITICESEDGNLRKVNYYRESFVDAYLKRIENSIKELRSSCAKQLVGYDEGEPGE